MASTCLQGIWSPTFSYFAAIQGAEYIIYSVLSEAIMSSLGNVACLCGPFTYVRLEALLAIFDADMARSSDPTLEMNEYWKRQFGDDRWITLNIARVFGSGSTEMFMQAVSQTKPARTFRELVLQRRRWYLGTISTEAAALCNIKFWTDTPLLNTYRLCQKLVAAKDLPVILLGLLLSRLEIRTPWYTLPCFALGVLLDLLVLKWSGVKTEAFGDFYRLTSIPFPFLDTLSPIAAMMMPWKRRW